MITLFTTERIDSLLSFFLPFSFFLTFLFSHTEPSIGRIVAGSVGHVQVDCTVHQVLISPAGVWRNKHGNISRYHLFYLSIFLFIYLSIYLSVFQRLTALTHNLLSSSQRRLVCIPHCYRPLRLCFKYANKFHPTIQFTNLSARCDLAAHHAFLIHSHIHSLSLCLSLLVRSCVVSRKWRSKCCVIIH